MKEKVDILLATYKSNIKYLKKQIDSILNQTYKDISLLISDDNSQDEELEKTLKEYEQKDNRVHIYFQEKNIGYIKNFGFLLEKSTAEYIMYSDHDDIWYPEKVEKSLKELVENDVDLVYVNSKRLCPFLPGRILWPRSYIPEWAGRSGSLPAPAWRSPPAPS